MTIYRYKNFIPGDGFKINPKAFTEDIFNFFNNYIENIYFEKKEKEEEDKKVLNKFYKEFKNKIVNYQIWYENATYNHCCYIYTDLNKININRICGRRIDKKSNQDNINKYFCAEHDRDHRKNKSKKIKINEKKRCNIICNNGKRCKYTYLKNGICEKHIKYGKNNNNVYICKYDIKNLKIIEKSNKNYGKLYYNKEININHLKVKPSEDISSKMVDIIKSPIISAPILKNKLELHIKPINKYMENIKQNIIKNIETIDDEYKLIYLYNFTNNIQSPGQNHKRTIIS